MGVGEGRDGKGKGYAQTCCLGYSVFVYRKKKRRRRRRQCHAGVSRRFKPAMKLLSN